MSKWWDIRDADNRAMLGWVGSGLAVVIASLWGAFIYFNQSKSGDGGSNKVEASCGGAAVQGTMVGSSITTGGASSTANCPPKSK